MGLRAHLLQLELLRRSQAADGTVRSARAAYRRAAESTATRTAYAAIGRARRAAETAAASWRAAWPADLLGRPPARAAAAANALLEPCADDMADLLLAADVVLVSTSAGKDSLVQLHLLAKAADKLGVLHKLVCVHAHLGEAEWDGVADLARRQAERYGVRFIQVAADEGFLGMVERRGKWPDAKRRLCTAFLKRQQCTPVIRQLVDELDLDRQAVVLNCMGIRAQESPARAKKGKLVLDARSSSGKRLVLTYHPVFDMTSTEIWWVIARAGLEYHEVYDADLPRLSCIYCVLVGFELLVRAARICNALGIPVTARYVGLEEAIGHTFKHGLAIADVAAEAARRDAAEGLLTWERGDAIRRHLGDAALAMWKSRQAS